MQGFPILKNQAATGEHERERFLDMGIKIAHLSSDVANAGSIHQAKHGAMELSEQTGNRPGACLTAIFSQGDTSPPMQSISMAQCALSKSSRRSGGLAALNDC